MKMNAGVYCLSGMLRGMPLGVRKFVNKARWLGLSVFGSLLLLSTFLLFTWGIATPDVEAATPATITEAAHISFERANYTFNEADGSVPILILIDPILSTSVTVTVSSANIEAEASQDFEGLRQSLVIAPGEQVYTISVTLIDDALVEEAEQLSLTLSNPQGALPGPITETLIIIEDNDVAYLRVSDVTVNEEAESVSLVITQSITSAFESLVDVLTIEGSATAPEDFEALVTTVAIPPGSTEATATVKLNGDDLYESTESFIIQLQNAINAQIANVTATVTLIDDDFYPELTLESAEANERDGALPFVVTLSSAWEQTVTVDYTTLDGSAIATADYLTSTGVLTIAPGSLTATVSVTLIEDQIDEPDESFYLILSNPVQAILSTDQVEGIIHDSFPEVLFLPGIVR